MSLAEGDTPNKVNKLNEKDDLVQRMSLKIGQLTKMIYNLNIKHDNLEMKMKEAESERFRQIKEFRANFSKLGVQDLRTKLVHSQQLLQDTDSQRQKVVIELKELKENISERLHESEDRRTEMESIIAILENNKAESSRILENQASRIELLELELGRLQAENNRLENEKTKIIKEAQSKIDIMKAEVADARINMEMHFRKQHDTLVTQICNWKEAMSEDYEWKQRELEKQYKKKLNEKEKEYEDRLHNEMEKLLEEVTDGKDERALNEARSHVTYSVAIECNLTENVEHSPRYKSLEAEVKQLQGLTGEQQKALKTANNQIDLLKDEERALLEEIKHLQSLVDSRKKQVQWKSDLPTYHADPEVVPSTSSFGIGELQSFPPMTSYNVNNGAQESGAMDLDLYYFQSQEIANSVSPVICNTMIKCDNDVLSGKMAPYIDVEEYIRNGKVGWLVDQEREESKTLNGYWTQMNTAWPGRYAGQPRVLEAQGLVCEEEMLSTDEESSVGFLTNEINDVLMYNGTYNAAGYNLETSSHRCGAYGFEGIQIENDGLTNFEGPN